MRTRLAPLCLLALAATLVGACNLPRPSSSGALGNQEARTAAALTVVALGTQLAGGTLPAPVSAITLTPPSGSPTGAAQPGETPGPAASLPPATALAAASPTAPAATPAPTATAAAATSIPTPCDQVKLDGETIPDGTAMVPGQSFTKTWTLKNTGTCTWTASYALVFVSGDAMSGPAAQQITTGTVAPGQSIQVSVDLHAPSTDGTFRGDFKLRNAAGVLFGLGPNADQNFWVEIKVAAKQGSMMDDYCLAAWTAGSTALACPGKQADAHGFVLRVDSPKLENGSIDNEPALWTNPPVGSGAQISGRFLPVMIASGAHFRSVVGCFSGAANCDVKFTLQYSADHGAVKNLGDWDEKMDGQMTHLDVDLSSLSGRAVELILTVTANSASDGQQAYWLDPQIS
jgi:hypothetical protein